jgi:3-methylcrotonyl-CoA carboxylase alpha subunit
MIAKLIVWDEDRDRALARMASALREYRISGVTNNLNFLYDLATSVPFVNAELDTGFIEKHSKLLFAKPQIDLTSALSHAGLFLLLSSQTEKSADPWGANNAWRMNQANIHQYDIQVGDEVHMVKIEQKCADHTYVIHFDKPSADTTTSLIASATLIGKQLLCTLDGHQQEVMVSLNPGDQNTDHNARSFLIFNEYGSIAFQHIQADCGDDQLLVGGNNFVAPMNGTIIEVLVKANEKVSEGQAIVIMEAMKMQHTMQAPSDGIVTELFCSAGDLVDGGSELLNFETLEEE